MLQIAQCASLDEVRQNIDRVDRQMLALIAERGAYVKQAARFKKDAGEVAAPQRVAQVIARVCDLGRQCGAEPAVVEATWRAMIAAFIEAEHAEHRRLHPPSPH